VSVRPKESAGYAHPVQIFDNFTKDLQRLADWLVSCGVPTVAIESTAYVGFRSTIFWKGVGCNPAW
jgi:hypothetical protein